MLECDLRGVECGVEAVRRGMGGDHGDGAFSVPAVESLIEVGLFGLGRDAGRRACALHIHHHEREFGHYGESQGFALQRESGAGSRGDREIARIGRSDGGADAGYLVFGLQGLGAQALVDCEFLENIGGRRDWIRPAEEGQTALFGSGEKPPRSGLIAGDVAISSLLGMRRLDMIGVGYHLHVVP